MRLATELEWMLKLGTPVALMVIFPIYYTGIYSVQSGYHAGFLYVIGGEKGMELKPY